MRETLKPMLNSETASHHTIPFAQRPTCTISEACEAIGLGRSKLYELIGDGQLETARIGRRRLPCADSIRRSVVAP